KSIISKSCTPSLPSSRGADTRSSPNLCPAPLRRAAEPAVPAGSRPSAFTTGLNVGVLADNLIAPLDFGAVVGFGHRALARPVDHLRLLEQHPALALAGGLGHDPGQRVEQADHHGR